MERPARRIARHLRGKDADDAAAHPEAMHATKKSDQQYRKQTEFVHGHL
jgi:polyisoprenoid-binding protein YceI